MITLNLAVKLAIKTLINIINETNIVAARDEINKVILIIKILSN